MCTCQNKERRMKVSETLKQRREKRKKEKDEKQKKDTIIKESSVISPHIEPTPTPGRGNP